VALGNVDIFVQCGSGVVPFFHLLMFDPLVMWRKLWFFLRNDIDASLPWFTGSRLIPQPKWRYGVAQKDIRKLQPLREVIQQLLCGELTGADLLRTFVSCRVQPLYKQKMTMWVYLGPNCPDCPFSVDFG
jgi:hypothetical protein